MQPQLISATLHHHTDVTLNSAELQEGARRVGLYQWECSVFPTSQPVLFLCPLAVFTDQCRHQHSKQYNKTITIVHEINHTDVALNSAELQERARRVRNPPKGVLHFPFFPTSSPCVDSLPLTVFTDQCYFNQCYRTISTK